MVKSNEGIRTDNGCAVRHHQEQKKKESRELEKVFVVFDGPPGPECGRFVEVETPDGKSVSTQVEWKQREDGYWVLGPFYA